MQRQPPRSAGKTVTALSLVGLVGLCASYPFWAVRGGSPVSEKGRRIGPLRLRSVLNLTLSFSIHLPSPVHVPFPQIDPSNPLPRQAAIRGPYTNTGSRDVGLDPKPKLSPPKL